MTSRATPPVSAGLFDVVCDFASLSTCGEASAALPDLLPRLAAETGAVACQLDTAVCGPDWTTLSSLAYPQVASRHLGGAFIASRHGKLVLDAPSAMRIGEDDPFNFRRSSHYNEVLRPAGFHDGISVALRSNDERVVGMLHLSATSHRDFHSGVLASLPPVGRAVARVVQLVSVPLCELGLPADFAAVQILGSGASWPVPGRALVVPAVEGELLQLVLTARAIGAETTPFLHRHGGALHEVRVLRSGHGAATARCVVAVRPARDVLGLTVRQLEVLTAVATGASNREIADELCLTPRTVAAHIEIILNRLGVGSRAGATARAVSAGVLLPRADTDSVRSLARLVRASPVTAA